VFGGTFDPVHKGHVAIARHVGKKVLLDRIICIPAADPPHKETTGAPFKHRVAMLELALAGLTDQVSLSLLEADRHTPSYTVDTLLELRNRLGNQEYYFILGADSLLELHLWYRFQDLPTLTNFIVVARPDISDREVSSAVAGLPGSFKAEKCAGVWRRRDGAKCIYLSDFSIAVASSTIRCQLERGYIPNTLDSRVRKYIIDHRLYGQK